MHLVYPRHHNISYYKLDLEKVLTLQPDYNGCAPDMITAYSDKSHITTITDLTRTVRLATNPTYQNAFGQIQPQVVIETGPNTTLFPNLFIKARRILYDSFTVTSNYTMTFEVCDDQP